MHAVTHTHTNGLNCINIPQQHETISKTKEKELAFLVCFYFVLCCMIDSAVFPCVCHLTFITLYACRLFDVPFFAKRTWHRVFTAAAQQKNETFPTNETKRTYHLRYIATAIGNFRGKSVPPPLSNPPSPYNGGASSGGLVQTIQTRISLQPPKQNRARG